jgi:trafficking protein particle complex subunit 10
MSWFGTLINASDGDDSAPLLSPNKKPYRDLILANKITIFELRLYILSRQCQLMAKMGHVDEIPRKVSAFLGAFSKTLKQVQVQWIYDPSRISADVR